MNNRILLPFLAGAAIGSIVTYFVAKTKFEQVLNEELDAMEEYYLGKIEKATTPEETSEEVPTEKEEKLAAVRDILKEEGYDNEGGKIMSDEPYVIPYEEYGEADGYDAVTLNYFADGVITDDWNEPLEDVAGTVGLDVGSHFGENEGDEDSVYIRNDRLKTDYEILRDVRKFSELTDEES